MTALLPSIRDDIEAATKTLDELYEAGDLPAIAWNLHDLVAVRKLFGDLLTATERIVIECAPWSGNEWQPDDLPVMQLRTGAIRKHWQWDELRTYLRRRILDPEDCGQFPSLEVIDAVDETLALMYQVAPLTGSTGPRVTAIAPLLKAYERDVDEFCEAKPGRVSVQIHGGDQ